MKKKLGVIAAVIGFLFGVILAGCSDHSMNSPMSNLSSDMNASSVTAQNISQSELTLMSAAGINVNDGKGVFSIGWRQLFDPKNQVENTIGHAMAVGFDGSTTTSGRKGGVDMGNVYVNYASNHLALTKRTTPDGKVIYSSAMGPKEGSSNIQFVANGTYEFEVTGASGFTAMNTSLTAPSALLNVTSPAKDASISTTNDLTITWDGGNVNAGVLIAIAARPQRPEGGGQHGPGGPPGGGMGNHDPGNGPPPQGPGGGHGGPGGGHNGPPPGGEPPMLDSTKAIIVKLDSNTGTYTVSASALQTLIANTHANGLMCTVSQMSVTDVNHDGGTVHVVFRNGDGVMVKVQ